MLTGWCRVAALPDFYYDAVAFVSLNLGTGRSHTAINKDGSKFKSVSGEWN